MTRPTIIIPVFNRPDLLRKAIDSIDFPWQHLVLVANHLSVMSDAKEIERSFANVHVVHAGFNLGFGASANYVFRRYPAPWLLLNNDIIFHPGSVEAMMKAYEADPDLCMITAGEGMTSALFTKHGIGFVGDFDENFWPAYCEDCDWVRRMVLSGGRSISAEGASVEHAGSQTINSDPFLSKLNSITHRHNQEYYRKKWGGSIHQEVHTLPFGKNPLSYWEIDPVHYGRNRRIWDAATG